VWLIEIFAASVTLANSTPENFYQPRGFIFISVLLRVDYYFVSNI